MKTARRLFCLGGLVLLLLSLYPAVAANGGSADAGGLRQRGQALRSQGQALEGQYRAIKSQQANLEAEKAKLAARRGQITKRMGQLQDEFKQKFLRAMYGPDHMAEYQLFVLIAEKWVREFEQDLVNIDYRRQEINGEMARLEQQKNTIRAEHQRIKNEFEQVKSQYYQQRRSAGTGRVKGAQPGGHSQKGSTKAPAGGTAGTKSSKGGTTTHTHPSPSPSKPGQ